MVVVTEEARAKAADAVAKAAQFLADAEPNEVRVAWDRLRVALAAWRKTLPASEHPWGTQR